MEKFPYTAEYAKSNRSSCKACRMGIGKDALRLGVMVQVSWFMITDFLKIVNGNG